jgi:hypothetical protein
MAILCNAIQTGDSSDLASLNDFVQNLESCRNLSDGAGRLYQMCQLLLHVVKPYFRLKINDIILQSQPGAQMGQYHAAPPDTISSFIPYFSALELMPSNFVDLGSNGNSSWREEGSKLAIETDQEFIQNWFKRSRNLMTLMKIGYDLQMPDFEFQILDSVSSMC